MKKKDDFYDDGRTIADMDVEGMPFQGRRLTPHKKNTDSDAPQLSPREQRQLVVSGMLAGVLIASVFIIAAAVLILILVTFG